MAAEMTEVKVRVILILNAVLTKAVYMLYPLLLVCIAIHDLTGRLAGLIPEDLVPDSVVPAIVPAVLVPGISFVLVSIFRSKINAPRPYEMPGAIPPVIKKDAPGKSFPSRHIFSIFVIAVTFFWVWPLTGIIIGIAGAVLAWCRVAGGVHFPRDVIAGALIGIGCGLLGYYLILPLI